MDEKQKQTVMLVEDDAPMLSVLRIFLELEGYQVLIAPISNSLEEIVQSVIDAGPDKLLVDVHIGSVSGLDVVSQLRSRTPENALRVVMASGMEMKRECMAAGADAFLLKPYMPEELISKLSG